MLSRRHNVRFSHDPFIRSLFPVDPNPILFCGRRSGTGLAAPLLHSSTGHYVSANCTAPRALRRPHAVNQPKRMRTTVRYGIRRWYAGWEVQGKKDLTDETILTEHQSHCS